MLHTSRGTAFCQVFDVSLSGVLLVSTSTAIHALGSARVELRLPGIHERHITARGRILPRNGAAVAVMFDEVGPEIEDAVAALGWLVRHELEHPRVLVVAREPSCSQVMCAMRRLDCVPLEAHTPLEAIVRLAEPVTATAAALIAIELTQTDGVELARFMDTCHPSTPVTMLDEVQPGDPEWALQFVQDIRSRTSTR